MRVSVSGQAGGSCARAEGRRAGQPATSSAAARRPLHQRAANRQAAAAGWSQRRHLAAVAAAAADDAPASLSEAAEDWIEVGRIGPPHGVRGEMKVQPLTDFPEDRLGMPGPRWLQAPAPKIGRRKAPPPEEVALEWGRSMISKGNEVWLVKLEECESPEEAALLRGHSLLIPASARPPLEDEDEFYVQDLVGLRVFLQASGEEVGTVADVFDGTGTHDVMRIQLAPALLARLASARAVAGAAADDSGVEEEEAAAAAAAEAPEAAGPRHVLLPFAKAMVPVVDLPGKRMEITPPEGLLELAAPSEMKKARRENRGRRERRRPRPRAQSGGDDSGGEAPASSGSSQDSS